LPLYKTTWQVHSDGEGATKCWSRRLSSNIARYNNMYQDRHREGLRQRLFFIRAWLGNGRHCVNLGRPRTANRPINPRRTSNGSYPAPTHAGVGLVRHGLATPSRSASRLRSGRTTRISRERRFSTRHDVTNAQDPRAVFSHDLARSSHCAGQAHANLGYTAKDVMTFKRTTINPAAAASTSTSRSPARMRRSAASSTSRRSETIKMTIWKNFSPQHLDRLRPDGPTQDGDRVGLQPLRCRGAQTTLARSTNRPAGTVSFTDAGNNVARGRGQEQR